MMQVSLPGILMCALVVAASGLHHNYTYVYACVHLIMCAYVCSCAECRTIILIITVGNATAGTGQNQSRRRQTQAFVPSLH